MKVTIQHSIDLEDVPEKASKLIMPAENDLSNALRWLGALGQDLSDNNITAEMASLSLDRIRRVMGSADSVLAEVENIMQGIADYKKAPPPAQAPQPPPTEGLQQPPPTEGLQQPPPSSGSDPFDKMMDGIDEEKQLAQDMLRAYKEKQNESDLPF